MSEHQMSHYKFLTIEEFAQWLEKSCEYNEQKADKVLGDNELRTAYIHAAFAYQHVANVVRSSNLDTLFSQRILR